MASSSSAISPDEALARALQMEADEALAAELAAELAMADAEPSGRSRGGCSQGGSSSSASGHTTAPATAMAIMVPVNERLAAPAHKQVSNLGRNTAKAICRKFGVGPSLSELLKLVDGPRAPEVFALVDAGQRSRVEAELAALRIDLLPSSSD